MLPRVFLVSILLAFPWPDLTTTWALAQIRVVNEVDLSSWMERKKAVRLEIGQGAILQLTAPQEGIFGERLVLQVHDQRVPEIKGGKFEEAMGVTVGSTTYWIVSEFSGGAHCCGVYHFFSQPGPDKPVRYLGKTAGHNGGPLPIAKALIDLKGDLFFRDLDNRFDYFHESHAGSRLVNLPERFYKLSPTGIRVNNLLFKSVYLEHAKETQKEIQEALKKRRARPAAILKTDGRTKFAFRNFSDEVGQLLVKRTIYLLWAREDQTAWQRFDGDVGHYYQTSRWAPELKAEIRKMRQGSPY